MRMRKLDVKIVIMLIIAFSLIVSGVVLYHFKREEIEPGIYLRQTYGFLGIHANNHSFIQLRAFNVGEQSLEFLKDVNSLSLGVEGIIITKVKVETLNQLREVEYLLIDLTIEMSVEEAQITKLVTSKGVFPIGSINLRQVEVSDSITNHGVLTDFISNEIYTIGFGRSNAHSFEIREIIFYHEKISSDRMDKKLPIKYQAKSDLKIDVNLTFDHESFDIFVLQPIIAFVLEGEKETSYFIPLMATKHERPMDYNQIKEYLRNA